VTIRGGGPAAEAVGAALSDCEATVDRGDPTPATDLAVIVGRVGSEAFDGVAGTAHEHAFPLLTVELGGVGGHAVVDADAAVTGFGPETACFNCLGTRVAANEPETEPTGGASDDATARLAGALAGRATVDVLDGVTSVLGTVTELPYAERRLLPVPHCSCGDGPDRRLRRGAGERSLDEALGAAEMAVDNRLGIVSAIAEAESFPVPYYLATLAESPFSDADVPSHAAGVAADWNPAYMKGLGEAMERYAAAVYRLAEFERGPAGAVGGAVPPSAFVTSDAFGVPNPREELRWVAGEHLETGEAVRLPAEFAVFPPPEVRHRPSITTGLGLGNSGTEALLSGLYEVVERDAAMLAWYSTYEPLGLAVETRGYRSLARRLQAEDLEASALLLTQDVDVPVVAVCVHREGSEWPQFAAGMAADLDPEAAAVGALEEAVQNFLELRGMGPEGARREGNIGEYAAFPEAVRAFVDPEVTVPADSVGPDSVPSGRAELETLVDRVADAGLDAYGARLTTRDLKTLGFEAVRVLVPAAQPLFTGEAYFGERAERVPESLGFEPRLEREPHPFP
jgi:ribosomal protein S12 methylthiotransferase accessory factor